MIKITYFLSVLLLITISIHGQTSQQQTLSKIEWLTGKWNRTNGKPGQTGVENWIKQSRDKFVGNGITLKGRDTIFSEKLQIIAQKDGIYYVAYVEENKKPVYFKFTEISDTGFVCENATHDFPKKISYQMTGKKLKVVVSGNGKSIDFEFIK
ncbi:hypothetical protein FMM05_00135 [Flavobacterium zepuense]|uniref:DUF6265 domain-containing protein n=1 Tax=Flavobacterium zepuense TaxID=2593302 RepID=A0A552V9F0_9FLAO|nr:DUF6265 family protein [Flavobacterium zepuense]TRW27094.1 hypothetical protein FMM05_00135 [Flavobacterium zepuense]